MLRWYLTDSGLTAFKQPQVDQGLTELSHNLYPSGVEWIPLRTLRQLNNFNIYKSFSNGSNKVMTTAPLLLRPSCQWVKTQKLKRDLKEWDFGDAEIKVPSSRSSNYGRKKTNENLVIKYYSKSKSLCLDTWNYQFFTHFRLNFSRWKVKLFASSEKKRVSEEKFQILAKKAIETFNQSNPLSFYWGTRTSKLSVSVSFNQAIGLPNRKKGFCSVWKFTSTFEF